MVDKLHSTSEKKQKRKNNKKNTPQPPCQQSGWSYRYIYICVYISLFECIQISRFPSFYACPLSPCPSLALCLSCRLFPRTCSAPLLPLWFLSDFTRILSYVNKGSSYFLRTQSQDCENNKQITTIQFKCPGTTMKLQLQHAYVRCCGHLYNCLFAWR